MSSTPFGEHLRRERELRGVSLEEIAAATRISTRFLEALENEQWDRLPGGAFNRGFIRSIARFLGIDEDGLVSEYAYERTSVDGIRSTRHTEKIPRAWGSVLLVLLIAGVVVAGGFWVFAHFRTAIVAPLHGRFTVGAAMNQAKAYATPTTLAAPSEVSTATAPVATDLALTIQASKPADLTVRADGQTVFAGGLQANDVKQFEAHETLEITSSDSTALVLLLNGQPMPWVGAPGEPGEMRLTRNKPGPPAEASH
jgi:cytoskeletal protein RodZ